MALSNYQTKAEEIKNRFPKTEAKAAEAWGGALVIEVATVDQAKALKEMNVGYRFKSGSYIS